LGGRLHYYERIGYLHRGELIRVRVGSETRMRYYLRRIVASSLAALLLLSARPVVAAQTPAANRRSDGGAARRPFDQKNLIYAFSQSGGLGAHPASTLIADPSGALYGTTTQGGTHGFGTVYALAP